MQNMKALGRLSLLLVLAGAILGTDDAFARATPRPDDQSWILYKAGVHYWNLGRYEDALFQFRESHRLIPRADVRYNMARCLDKLERDAEAIVEYRAYLDEAPTTDDRPQIERRIRELEDLRRGDHVVSRPASDQPLKGPQPPPAPGRSWVAMHRTSIGLATAAGLLAVGAGAVGISTKLSADSCTERACSVGDFYGMRNREFATNLMFASAAVAAVVAVIVHFAVERRSSAERQ